MDRDLSVVDTIEFGINYRQIERECLNYLVYVGEEYLYESSIDFSDLYVEDLFIVIENFLYDYIDQEISFLSPMYFGLEKIEVWDVARIIMAYLYLSKKVDMSSYFEEVDYIDIFRREHNIKDMIELLAIVVKRLFKIYFIEEVKVVHTAVLMLTKERMGEVIRGKREDLVKILDSASYAGITFRELRRWFYYFSSEDVLKYLSKRYTLERALEEVEDDDEGEEDEEE